MTQIYVERVRITQPNPCYIKVDCSESLLMELSNKFTFLSPKAKFDKRVRNGLWDGKIRLLNKGTRRMLAGLKELIKKYCIDNRYEFIDDTPNQIEKIPLNVFEAFIESLDLPTEIDGLPFELRDYQFESLRLSACLKRCIILSPTSSGKSLSIYLIARWFNKKTLIVVPTTTLVDQLPGDFLAYKCPFDISKIYAGQEKERLEKITVTTWQSVFNMPKEWLQQFEVIIGDEAHTFAAKSLQTIMENVGAQVRIGTTGTLDDEASMKVNKLVLQGLFGPIYRVLTTKQMIDRGFATPIKIMAYHFLYPPEIRKRFRPHMVDKQLVKVDYHEEINYLVTHKRRNDFIGGLALSRQGNVLVLFKSIEHGKYLYELIKKERKNAHLVYGEVETEDRSAIKELTEKSTDSIIIASYRTFATGINIRNLHHVILAAPIKSKILLIQSIGRSLRLGVDKPYAHVYDLGDDLSIGQYVNYAYKHFVGRLELYTKESFEYKITRIDL